MLCSHFSFCMLTVLCNSVGVPFFFLSSWLESYIDLKKLYIMAISLLTVAYVVNTFSTLSFPF